MGLHALSRVFLFLFFLVHGLCRLDFPLGSRVTIPLPPTYQPDFRGRAFLMDTGNVQPDFRAALSVEAVLGGDDNYSCSLSVFIGDLKAWASDHSVKFLPIDSCAIELTEDGDLQLQDGKGRIGWRTSTSGQGVKALLLEKKTGNLVLVDAKNHTTWQSFDSPGGDIILRGQRLNVSARLTSLPGNSSESYFLELHPDKLITYLNWGDRKYSYWELKPPHDRNFAFAILGSRGLKLFDQNSKKISQIQSTGQEPVRFLQLERTGNLGLYHYSTQQGNFKASYQALDRSCDLPLPCGPYGVCSSSNNGTCAVVPATECVMAQDCNSDVEMVELNGVDTVLRTASPIINVSAEICASLCKSDRSCAAALYSEGGDGSCFQYGLVGGAREVGGGTGFSFWVKVSKRATGGHQGVSSSLLNKILIVGGVVDGLALCLILGGILYYCFKIRERTDNSGNDDNR